MIRNLYPGSVALTNTDVRQAHHDKIVEKGTKLTVIGRERVQGGQSIYKCWLFDDMEIVPSKLVIVPDNKIDRLI